MKYIKVFTDFAKAMEPLGDAECGRLFKAMLKYAETGDTPEFCGNERFIWPTAKSNIDRDQESYDRICQRNRSNRNNQSSPVVTSGHQPSRHVQDKDKDKEKEKEKDSVLPDGSTARANRFAAFWAAYPRKQGKGAAEKAWNKIKPTAEVFDRIMAAVESQKGCEQWKRNNGQYIPNPSTWLNQRRWEDEPRHPSVQETDNIFLQMLQEGGGVG